MSERLERQESLLSWCDNEQDEGVMDEGRIPFVSLYSAVKEQRFGWLAYLVGPGNDYLFMMVDKYGEREEDEEFEDKEFSLRRLLHTHADCKVEIEDVGECDDPVVARKAALERLYELWKQILICGVTVLSVIFLCAFITYLDVKVYEFTPFVLIPLSIFHLWRIVIMTKLLSNTTFEKRPLVRMMFNLSGFDKYRMLTALAFMDLMGRFTRATFAVQALRTQSKYNEQFLLHLEQSWWFWTRPVMEHLGYGGVAALSLAVGPLLMQGGFMLYLVHNMRTHLAKVASRVSGGVGGEMLLDEYGALADWASMLPMQKVFTCAATPLALEDRNDARRFWGLMCTESLRVLVRIIPDSIISMNLQVAFLQLTFQSMGRFQQAHAVFSLFTTWASAMNTARGLALQFHAVTVFAALIIILPSIMPVVRVVQLILQAQ
jgi:hypothetical protein